MKIERITDFERLIPVKDEWNALVSSSAQNCVFLTHEWFCSWWQSFGEGRSLEVLLFRDSEDTLIGIAPLMLTEEVLGFIASREVTDTCDFIIRQGGEEEFFPAFLDYFQEMVPGVDRLHLMNIREESSSLAILSRLAAERRLLWAVEETEVAPRLDLPPTYEGFISKLSRRNRHELRRKVKKLDSLPELETKWVTNPDEMKDNLDAFIGLHRESSSSKRNFWQKKGMEEFFQSITAQFALNGWAELNMLCIRGELAAGLLSFVYKDEVYFYNMAFSPRFAPFSPGIYLLNRSIKQAIEQHKRRVDFLRGREKYKYSFGSKESKIMDFILSVRE